MFKSIKDLEVGEVFIRASSAELKVHSIIRICPKSLVVSYREDTVGADSDYPYTYEVFEEDINKHNSTKRISTNYRLEDNVYVIGRVNNP